MSIRMTGCKAPFVGDSSGGGGGGITRSDIYAGKGIITNDIGAAGIEIVDGIARFRDSFDYEKPCWQNTPVILSGDWQVNTGGGYLEGLAENNPENDFRYGIEGDFDYCGKAVLGGGSSHGFQFRGNSLELTIEIQPTGAPNEIEVTFTGEPTATVALGATTTVWLRAQRVGNTFNTYYKLNDTDAWTLITTYTGDMQDDVTASIDSSIGAQWLEFMFYDNTFPLYYRAEQASQFALTDAASISVDAAFSNVMDITLSGNRTLATPTNPPTDTKKAQMLLFRVRQDGTGSRTLSFSAGYRFSSSLPTPTLTTTPDAVDYLLFIYNQTDTVWDYVGEVLGFT